MKTYTVHSYLVYTTRRDYIFRKLLLKDLYLKKIVVSRNSNPTFRHTEELINSNYFAKSQAIATRK